MRISTFSERKEEKKLHAPIHRYSVRSNHCVEDIPLMEVDGDEGLELDPLNLGEVLGGDCDECLQHVLKIRVCFGHGSSLCPGLSEGIGCAGGPNDLDP